MMSSSASRSASASSCFVRLALCSYSCSHLSCSLHDILADIVCFDDCKKESTVSAKVTYLKLMVVKLKRLALHA